MRALIVTAVAAVVVATPAAAQLAIGQPLDGVLSSQDTRLEDGSYARCHDFAPPANQAVTIDMTSSDVDSYLMIFSGGCRDLGDRLAADDDSGGALNARITGTFAGPLVGVIANTVAADSTGAYRLSAALAAPGATVTAAPSTGGLLGMRPTSLPQTAAEDRWAAHELTCHAVYGAMAQLRDEGVGRIDFGNANGIDYAPRAAALRGRIAGSSHEDVRKLAEVIGDRHEVWDTPIETYRNNFKSMILIGSIGVSPNGQSNGGRPLATALTLLGDCDRAFGNNPVTTY